MRYHDYNLPPELEPLSPWAYLGYSILFSIPLIGLISLIVLAFSNKNINRRNFARSFFCYMLVAIGFLFLLVTLAGGPSILGTIFSQAAV